MKSLELQAIGDRIENTTDEEPKFDPFPEQLSVFAPFGKYQHFFLFTCQKAWE